MRRSLLVVVALAGGLGGCIVVDSMLAVDCIEHVRQDVPFAIPNDDAALEFKIDRCRLDRDACGELCTLALQRSGVGDPMSACHVDFSSTQAVVHVTFDRPTGAPGCAGGPISGGGGGGGGFPDAAIVVPF